MRSLDLLENESLPITHMLIEDKNKIDDQNSESDHHMPTLNLEENSIMSSKAQFWFLNI